MNAVQSLSLLNTPSLVQVSVKLIPEEGKKHWEEDKIRWDDQNLWNARVRDGATSPQQKGDLEFS